MKVQVIIDFWADGIIDNKEQLDCLKQILEDCDSSGVNISVKAMEILEE